MAALNRQRLGGATAYVSQEEKKTLEPEKTLTKRWIHQKKMTRKQFG